MTHPCDDIRAAASSLLVGKTIVLGVTGSIAAVETVTLARELIRHGADVIPVMTDSACRILHPDALWFATGNRPVTILTGDVEHVQFCGQHEHRADMLLVAPCTANTLSKIALGIDDTSVTMGTPPHRREGQDGQSINNCGCCAAVYRPRRLGRSTSGHHRGCHH